MALSKDEIMEAIKEMSVPERKDLVLEAIKEMSVLERKDLVLEVIKEMSVLELSELVKELEEVFGVSAAAPIAMATVQGVAGTAEAAAEEEKTEFDVTIKEIGPNKINVIKAVRELTTLGLKEAKELVEAAPSNVKEAIGKDEADQVKQKLEAAGAVVQVG